MDVHPAIAQNPYVFFREDDDLAARVNELRAYLTADDNLKLHTELLTLAEAWRDRGRPPDLLLPPARLEEARDWLAAAPARHPKPSALQLEYVHSSRRQPPQTRTGAPLAHCAGLGHRARPWRVPDLASARPCGLARGTRRRRLNLASADAGGFDRGRRHRRGRQRDKLDRSSGRDRRGRAHSRRPRRHRRSDRGDSRSAGHEHGAGARRHPLQAIARH